MGFLDSLKEKFEPNFNKYGLFMISKSITQNSMPIKYSWRNQSNNENLNGWYIIAEGDDQEFLNNPNNFEIVSGDIINKISPEMIKICESPYGTDLEWIYENGHLASFRDLKTNRDISIDELIENL